MLMHEKPWGDLYIQATKPCSNHEIHVLFEHGIRTFDITRWVLLCLRYVHFNRESVDVIFQNVFKTNDLNLQYLIEGANPFTNNQNMYPIRVICPYCWAI